MRYVRMLLAAFAISFALSGTALSSPISEEAYLDLVMERNNALKALRSEIRSRGFSIRSDVASQRPSVNLAAETDRWLDHDRGDRYVDLAVTHRFDLAGRYGIQERDLVLGLDILRCSYADSVNDLLARAASTYRSAVMAALKRDAMERILGQRRRSLLVTQEKFDKELVPRLDLLRAKSQVDDGEALVLQARQTCDQRLIELSALAGRTPVAPVVAVPTVTSADASVDPETAWRRRPDVTALLLTKERASLARSLAARGLSPVLDVSVGLRLIEDYRSSYAEDQKGEVLAKLVLSLPIADGGKTSNATKAQALLVEKASRELDARRDSLRKEVDLVRERWISALQAESIRRRQSVRASEELEIADMMYREGLASQLDLINAQEARQKTLTEHLSAVEELWLVLAEADRVMGRYVRSGPE